MDACWQSARRAAMVLITNSLLMFGSGRRRVKADAGLANSNSLDRKNAEIISTGGYPDNDHSARPTLGLLTVKLEHRGSANWWWARMVIMAVLHIKMTASR